MSFPVVPTFAATIFVSVCYFIFLKVLLDRKILTLPAAVVFGLAGIIAYVEIFSLVSRFIPSSVLQWMFDPDKEKNVNSTFSSMLLFSTALPAVLIGIHLFRQRKRWVTAAYWVALGLIFLFMAFDEYFLIHERLPSWHLLYAIFGGTLVAITVLNAWFFDRQNLRFYVLIFLALAATGIGGIGFDLPGSPIPFGYVFRITIEEFLELIGSSLTLFVTLSYLYQHGSSAAWRLSARAVPVLNVIWLVGVVFWTFWPLSWLEVANAAEATTINFLDGDLSFMAYRIETDTEPDGYLKISEYWRPNAELSATYAHALKLIDPETRAIISQTNIPMHPDLPPTEGWIPDLIYKKVVDIPLDDVAPGEYLLALQAWEEPAADPKLTITDTDHELIQPDTVVLTEITIP